MFTSLHTDRLQIRPTEMNDLDALVARRNDAETARYQSWSVPYSPDAAKQMLTSLADMDGPTDGEWWMATVVESASGAIVGDLAVHVTWGGKTAEIGYTLGAEYRRKGFASEAVDALVTYLFTHFGAQRLEAIMHPDNLPSIMVAERAGMRFEGRKKLSFWVGDGAEVENSDDVLYGMTRDDWDRWRHRPTDRPNTVRLVEITPTNQRSVRALETHKSQELLVPPVAVSYGDALFPREIEGGGVHEPWMRAVEADGELVGFVMLSAATEHHPEPYLWRFLIDRFHQRRGIGNAALDLLEEQLRAEGNTSVAVTWTTGRGSAGPFYLARGYEPTGEDEDGDVRARKQL